jgi:hypothetical protein
MPALNQHGVVTPDQFEHLLQSALEKLAEVPEHLLPAQAAALEWTRWETIDHTIDCVFSYAMQVAAPPGAGFLPFSELHALPEASPTELLAGLQAVGTMFVATVRSAPPDLHSSDGIVSLGLSDWCARAGYELAVHTHDTVSGTGIDWALSPDIARSIVESQALWMFDRNRAEGATRDAWTCLLLGSGRSGPR